MPTPLQGFGMGDGTDLALKRTLLYTSQRWDRDAGDGGGPERHRRFGDDPPSPWPAESVVERLGRLYGTVWR